MSLLKTLKTLLLLPFIPDKNKILNKRKHNKIQNPQKSLENLVEHFPDKLNVNLLKHLKDQRVLLRVEKFQNLNLRRRAQLKNNYCPN